MNEVRDILKSGIWYSVGNVFVKAISFLALPIFTNIMSTEEYGIFATYQAYETIVAVIIGLGISGTIRSAYNEYKEQFNDFISAVITPIIIFVGILLVADGLAALFLKNKIYAYYGFVLILNCFGNAIRDIFSQKYVVQNKYKLNLAVSLCAAILNISISYMLCFTLFYEERHFARIWGTAISAFSVGVIIYLNHYHRYKKWFWFEAWFFSLKLGIPIIFHQLSLSVLGQCDKIMIQNFVGLSEAGVYASMVTIILVPQVLMFSFDNAWAGWFFNNSRRNESEGICTIVSINKKLVYTFMLVMSCFCLGAHEVVKIMVGLDYRSGVSIIYILGVSVFVNFLYIFSVNVEYYYKKTGMIAIYTLISAIINICLNFVFILILGYIGAALATVISRFILLILHSKKANKLIGFNMVGMKELICSICFVIASSCVASAFEDNTILRWILILLLILFGCIYVYNNFVKCERG